MMQSQRRWGIGSVATIAELAEMLTQRTWTLCSGFYVKGHPEYLFLNDATSEDGAGEYGVCRKIGDDHFVQIESITFSWCDEIKAMEYIRQTLAGDFNASEFARQIDLRGRLDRTSDHHRCPLCA